VERSRHLSTARSGGPLALLRAVPASSFYLQTRRIHERRLVFFWQNRCHAATPPSALSPMTNDLEYTYGGYGMHNFAPPAKTKKHGEHGPNLAIEHGHSRAYDAIEPELPQDAEGLYSPGPTSEVEGEGSAHNSHLREASVGHVLQLMKHFRDLASDERQEAQLSILGVGHVLCWYHKGARPLKGIVVNGTQTFSTFSKFRDFATLQLEAAAATTEPHDQGHDYQSWSIEAPQWRTEGSVAPVADTVEPLDRSGVASSSLSPARGPVEAPSQPARDAEYDELYDASATLLNLRRRGSWVS